MKNYIQKAIKFADYTKLIDDLLTDNKTTGTNQSDAMVGYGKLNRQRMLRLEKTIVTSLELKAAAWCVERPMIWLTITEGWCGDAAQNIPVIEKIAAESDKIETRYILRDENLDLMDQYLTNGARSIPKLIAVDAETFELLGTWGARPLAAQKLFAEMKAGGVEKAGILEEMQRWYNNDKGRSLQREFESLLSVWGAYSAYPAAAAAFSKA